MDHLVLVRHSGSSGVSETQWIIWCCGVVLFEVVWCWDEIWCGRLEDMT